MFLETIGHDSVILFAPGALEVVSRVYTRTDEDVFGESLSIMLRRDNDAWISKSLYVVERKRSADRTNLYKWYSHQREIPSKLFIVFSFLLFFFVLRGKFIWEYTKEFFFSFHSRVIMIAHNNSSQSIPRLLLSKFICPCPRTTKAASKLTKGIFDTTLERV